MEWIKTNNDYNIKTFDVLIYLIDYNNNNIIIINLIEINLIFV